MPKQKKKPTTFRKKELVPRSKKGTGLKLPGTDEKFKRSYDGQDPRKTIVPDQRPDFEKVAADPVDEAAEHQFPPPKKDPIFRKMWMLFIDSVVRRQNFNTSHLNNLEILCDLYVDYDQIRTFLRVNGRSYKVQGRQGEIWKFFPEVELLNRVLTQIKDYTRLLGLLLKKDSSGESDGESENWD